MYVEVMSMCKGVCVRMCVSCVCVQVYVSGSGSVFCVYV